MNKDYLRLSLGDSEYKWECEFMTYEEVCKEINEQAEELRDEDKENCLPNLITEEELELGFNYLYNKGLIDSRYAYVRVCDIVKVRAKETVTSIVIE